MRWTNEGNAGFPSGVVEGRVVRLRDGRYRLYSGIGSLRVFTSADGRTWQEEPSASIRAPDPGCTGCYYALGDVAIMPDGSYRMFYEQRVRSMLFTDTGSAVIASATSADGLVWQKDAGWRGDVFVEPGAIGQGASHPRVLTLPDGTYRMFYWSGYAILSATSRDGQTWAGRKFENVFGADPDILPLPDGRLVLFVNWRDDSAPNGPAQTRMWSYVWQQVPFAFTSPAPAAMSLRVGDTQTRDLTIVGTRGTDIRFTATVYSTKGIYSAGDAAGPAQVQLTPTPDGATVRLTVTARQAAFGGIVITAESGTTRVSTVVPLNIAAGAPAASLVPLAWPADIGTSHFGLMGYRRETPAFAGAWARPHPGPFVWNTTEKTPGSYEWSAVDQQVRQWQNNRVAVLATIWPFAAWDQLTCHSTQPQASGTVFRDLPSRLYAPCDQQAYTRWLTALVDRYDGDGVNDMTGLQYPIRHWEVANEPELQGSPQSDMTFFQEGPQVYLELLQASYAAIKAADPNAVVLPGGQAGMLSHHTAYWNAVLPGARGSFDLGNVHSIGGSATFYGPEYRLFLDQSGYVNLPFWITEALAIKMAPPGQPPITDDQQARTIFTGYATDFASGADVIFNIGASGGGQSGGSSAAAESAFNVMAKIVGAFKTAKSVSPTAIQFAMRDGSTVYALWNNASLPAGVTGPVTVTTYTGQQTTQDAPAVTATVPILVNVPAR